MKIIIKIVIILVVSLMLYFGNHFVQKRLGESAVEALAFPVYSLEEGLSIAQQQGKLILADYSAIWCPTCRRLDKEVFADEKVAAKISQEFVYVRLEYDSESGLAFAKKHDLQGFPRILVLNEDNAKITELPLVFDPNIYAGNLQKVVLAQQQAL